MSTRSKTGLMNISPDKVSYKILQWMQNHPGLLKRTTGHILAGKLVEEDNIENGEVTIEQTISRMVACNVIYREKYPHSKYSDFRINYWHKSIPADILADAPVEVKRAMAKTIDDMKPNQYMDDEGCVVIPSEDDPFSEDIGSAIDPWENRYDDGEEISPDWEYETIKTNKDSQEEQPDPDDYQPKPAVSMQELYAQTYCNNLAEDERFKPYAEYIRSGEFLQELSKYGITLFDENGEINDGQIKAFLGYMVKDLEKKEEKEEETGIMPLKFSKTTDGKTTNVTINLNINL